MLLVPVALKLALLVASGVAHQIAMTPPNPPAKKIIKPNFFERNVHYLVKLIIYPFWMSIILDAFTTVLAAIGTPASALPFPISKFIASQYNTQALLLPSATFVFGGIVLVTSAYFRLLCYKTLGDQFRYEVSIQAKHKLVTSGPYSFVRHPSYLALYGDYIGSLAIMLSRGAYFRECVLEVFRHTLAICTTSIGAGRCEEALSNVGTFHIAALFVFSFWVGNVLLCERRLFGRLRWEDEILHREFGKEWEKYAERVCWRILPGFM